MTKNSFSGNIGEWSEPYVVFKLLAEGQLHQADANMLPSKMNFAKIIGIFREDTKASLDDNGNATFEFNDANGITHSHVLSSKELGDYALGLYCGIYLYQGRSFQIPQEDAILKQLGFSQLKNPVPKGQKSVKRDISLKIIDPNTGIVPKLGFSIKSELGSAPTLLNASGATNVVYKLEGFDDAKMQMVNSILTNNKLIDRAQAIKRNAKNIVFDRFDSLVFYDNLLLIDSGLPQIVSDALFLFYFEQCISTEEMLNKIKDLSHYSHMRKDFCLIKYKRFLRACALGMIPSEPWDDVDEASGGYIIVLPKGELIAFYVYNRALFDQYLIKNTKFERPSMSRHKYMAVYKEGSDYFVKLNLQIRFTK